ncbi:amylo-alpha-1,6-glucosidase [Herbidospora daliensis]|uniref:amylo-alpha-1,6-glucosidase n=1 Tax=Herbidospora daliensis TaxID=295585 RepID=UPI000780F0F3|nr:glycogen debranching N-terminal domain-containing protein [Herbidospora daliensis]
MPADSPSAADVRLQPLLHDLVSTVTAPTSALGGADGQIRAAGVQGVFHADRRVVSEAVLLIDGREAEPIAHAAAGPGRSRFTSLARWLGDVQPDPVVRVDRLREIRAYGLTEEITVASTATMPVTTTVAMRVDCDLAAIETVKSGHDAEPVTPVGGELTWVSGGTTVAMTGEGAQVHGRELRWEVALKPGESVRLCWRVMVTDPAAVVAAPTGPVEWTRPALKAADSRLSRLLAQSLDDLAGLRLTETGHPADTFLGAGVPWFLTVFGRDSLWAARMLLPLGTGLAGGTLRVLARRQGVKRDPLTGEAPGKIMHELRRGEFVVPVNGLRLPAAYYGTIDATPLWISLLHDAWRWGLPDREVEALLPAMEAALGWLATDADPDGDGFLEYIDVSGRGLANQGWKDSGDSVRFRDGRLADPPIALAEVQGYAYEAAVKGAAILDAFGRPGADVWRAYAASMACRFRERFWVEGGYPALALDRDKRPVDALTSNIGHLLGTGLLNHEESARVASLLASPEMSAGFGLRTMSSADKGFSPLSYHCGSVWPHDTAIVIAGLAREGFGAEAAVLAEGLLAAAEPFENRLPELLSGDARDAVGRPVPYPASCRPQAWSAAAAVVITHAALGLHPDVPGGTVDLRPMAGAPLGALAADGFVVAGTSVSVSVDAAGTAEIDRLPGRFKVVTTG